MAKACRENMKGSMKILYQNDVANHADEFYPVGNKNQSFKGFKDSQREPHIEKLYHFDDNLSNETKLNLVTIMIKHLDRDNFDDIDFISEKIKPNLGITNFGNTLICSKCRNIKFLKNFKCGHSMCFFCFRRKVKELMDDPSCKKIQELACKKCFELPSDDEFFGSELSEINFSWKNVQVIKRCTWCKRNLKLGIEYLFELTCLHLCKDCYLDQIYMGANKCMTCNAGFKNLTITEKRTCKCSKCGIVGNTIRLKYRCYKEGFNLCYSCQNKCDQENQHDMICSIFNGEQNLRHFNYYTKKICPYCNKRTDLDRVLKCPCCENIVCRDCFDQDIKLCQTCNISFKFLDNQ